jgi:methionyl-tRNA formyltransferase
MKILLLGPDRPEFIAHLESLGDRVVHVADKLSQVQGCLEGVDFLISYGYIYKVPAEVIAKYQDRIINLHISLLPWNKGNDPNLWSFLEDTPKGVTIHYMTDRIDGGNILFQKQILFDQETTFRTTYDRLHREIAALFKQHWASIRGGGLASQPQMSQGTYHRPFDRTPYEPLLTQGWDTPVSQLVRKAYPCTHFNNEPS